MLYHICPKIVSWVTLYMCLSCMLDLKKVHQSFLSIITNTLIKTN